jgi:pSer/pThr/pTyr-binding forkhead associated (FHA) protein
MSKLILQFNGRVLNEWVVGAAVTIGRQSDNVVVIDNPAVSGHHARVVRDGDHYVLEDLASTNGTFVNEQATARHTLAHGDAILIGKHTLVFDALGVEGSAAVEAPGRPAMPELGGTVFLDTVQHRALLAKMGAGAEAAPVPASASAGTATLPAPAPSAAPASRVGVLRVIDGRADESEYELTSYTSVIGSSATALVRLKGWFKPKTAVAIARKGPGYVATPLGGKTFINGQRLEGRYDLQEGDILIVSGLMLEFQFKQ